MMCLALCRIVHVMCLALSRIVHVICPALCRIVHVTCPALCRIVQQGARRAIFWATSDSNPLFLGWLLPLRWVSGWMGEWVGGWVGWGNWG